MSFKDEWNLEIALKILQHPTVDSQLWSEAAEWLLRYGPPSIQKILLNASQAATELQFPDLKPTDFTADGMPVYDTARLADILGIAEDEVRSIINEKGLDEETANVFSFVNSSRTIH